MAVSITSTTTVGGSSGDLIRTSATRRTATTSTDGLIGDTIFLDRNGNNSADDGEGIEGVTVYLYDSTGTTLLDTTITDENGHYYFGGLSASGTYTVKDGTDAARLRIDQFG